MDDLKLFMKNEDQLKQALAVVKNFSSDIQMTFGLEQEHGFSRSLDVAKKFRTKN